jgi:hypothetical protein
MESATGPRHGVNRPGIGDCFRPTPALGKATADDVGGAEDSAQQAGSEQVEGQIRRRVVHDDEQHNADDGCPQVRRLE